MSDRARFLVFVLTSSLAAVAASGTVVFWLLCSDYFFAGRFPGWNDWLDQYLFLVPSILLVGGLAVLAGSSVAALKNPQPVGEIGFVEGDDKFTPAEWRQMLTTVAGQLSPGRVLAKTYFRWLARGFRQEAKRPWNRREALHGPRAVGIGRRVGALWFVALCAFLAESPLPIAWMGDTASHWQKGPAVTGLRSEGPNNGLVDVYELSQVPPGKKQIALAFTAPIAPTITVYANDFPRTDRLVEFVCEGETPACGLGKPDDSKDQGHTLMTIRLRRGQAAIYCVPKPERPDLKIHLAVSLLSRSRILFDSLAVQ